MNELQITEYKNIRVLTTQQIAEAYGTDSKTISYNFNHNKERYIDLPVWSSGVLLQRKHWN